MSVKNAQISAGSDWHPADIKAALEKNGWNLSQLSKYHGYKNRTQLNDALTRHYPKAERLIAEAIGERPENIWPSRYQPKHRRSVRKTAPIRRKNSPSTSGTESRAA